jgi:hypothetical protein
MTTSDGEAAVAFMHILLGCFVGTRCFRLFPNEWYISVSDACFENAETASFHGGITLASIVVLRSLDCVARWRKRVNPPSSIRKQLRYAFLAFCKPNAYLFRKFLRSRYSHISLCLFYSSLTKFLLLVVLSIWGPQIPKDTPPPASYVYKMPLESPLWHLLDDDVLDRTWLVRNLLGGMSAGFGLRGACVVVVLSWL